jgi:hypothetical protein
LPYQKLLDEQPDGKCTVCGSPANILKTEFHFGTVVDCSRCGDFKVAVVRDFPLPFTDDKQKALASYLIRRMQQHPRAILSRAFFASIREQSLPTPAELCDNLLLWFSKQSDGRVGVIIGADGMRSLNDPDLLASIGAIDGGGAQWAAEAIKASGYVSLGIDKTTAKFSGQITPAGWSHIEELQRAHVASRYAFFARKFANAGLDTLYDNCLKQAVADTGFELRTVTQKAGHIDAIIEDEIRRCRFLLADLSDGNAGAYWEAGLAEGLGKPVIYICRDKIETHFDTDHRQTVRWDLTKLDETAKRLKAVIRNTLLGDAKQED